MQATIDALRPYPQGLLTNVGMVVANPALDANTSNIAVFDRRAYHGTGAPALFSAHADPAVIWSWQQALMAAGLARQLAYCSNSTDSSIDVYVRPPVTPSWCSNSTFVSSVRAAQTRLWLAINGAASEKFSEVWSYNFNNATNRFSVVDLASLAPEGTESDAIQVRCHGYRAR